MTDYYPPLLCFNDRRDCVYFEQRPEYEPYGHCTIDPSLRCPSCDADEETS